MTLPAARRTGDALPSVRRSGRTSLAGPSTGCALP
jgi:hypothetical protein